MDKEFFWKQFPLGSHLCREPMPPMNELKHDMEVLKKNGFNLVKLQENWMLDEPSEGTYDFSKYHELIEYADFLDMGVYLGLTCEQAPNWLYEKYPDCAMENIHGQRVAYIAQSTLSADGKPGPCFDHPGANMQQLLFIQKLVTELGRHKNIVVWNTWQEIAYWAERLGGGHVCYCPNTIHRYQQWLSMLYKSNIDSLNQHWNCRYSCFDQIQPDRSPFSAVTPQQFFYRFFIDNVKISDTLRERCRVIRENDPYSRPVFAHKGGMTIGSGHDWNLAKQQDFLGSSCYPAWACGHPWDDIRQKARIDTYEGFAVEMWDSVALRMTYLRSASQKEAPVWAAEFQGGPIAGDLFIGRTPDAGDIRRWMLTAIGAGITGLSFWVTRAEIMASEANGFSLLDSTGDTTERISEAARIGRAIQENKDLFIRNNKCPATTAILVDEWKYQMSSTMSHSMHENIAYDTRGWYKALWDNGISCDFIDASASIWEMQEYKLIIVPMPFSLSDDLARRIKAYVEEGGCIIIEGAPGRINEAGYATRGEMNPTIRNLVSIEKVEGFRMIREPDASMRWTHKETMLGEYIDFAPLEGVQCFEGFSTKPNLYIETYSGNEKDICLRIGGAPAGLNCAIRKGRIIIIGTCIGYNATAHRDNCTKLFFTKLFSLCGVHSDHAGSLLLSKRGDSNAMAWFLTNPANERIVEDIAIPEGFTAMDMLNHQNIPIHNGRIQIGVDPVDVRVIILKRG